MRISVCILPPSDRSASVAYSGRVLVRHMVYAEHHAFASEYNLCLHSPPHTSQNLADPLVNLQP